MSDFRAHIVGQVDLSKARQDIEAFLREYENNPIDLKVNVQNVNKSNGIIKQFQDVGKQAGKKFNVSLQEQIEYGARTQYKPFSSIYDSLEKQDKKYRKSYSDFWNKEFNKPVNKNYGKNQQIVAYDEYAEQLESQIKKATEIKKRVSQGYLDVDSSNIAKNLNSKKDFKELSSYADLEKTYNKLISLKKELSTGVTDDVFGRKLNDNDYIDKYNQYLDILEKAKNQSKVLANEVSSSVKPFNKLDATIASNRTLSWLENNTKAAKKYGAELRDLAELQRSSTSKIELDDYTKRVRGITSKAQSEGLTGRSAMMDLKRAFSQITQFAGVYDVIQNIVFEVPRQMVKSVKDINAAQIELTKVSTAPQAQLTKYWDEAAVSAKKYGSTINDVINSTSDWSRLGYNLEDAKELSDVTTLLSKVGDNMTQESSSEGLISTLKGFQMEADQAESIVDKVNEVANTQPIDTAGLFEGLKRSASSMSAANNSLEQTIALITAANSVVQDADVVGTTFKTKFFKIVFMYRNVHSKTYLIAGKA